MYFKYLAVLLGLALALAACGAVPAAPAAAPTAQPEPTAQPTAQPEPTIQPVPTTQPQSSAGVLVSYHKSGGIMGLDETLTVAADGRLTLKTTKGERVTGQAAPADLGALAKLLGSPEFAALEPRYQANGADLFVYEISVPGRAQPVVTMDGAQHPQVLADLIGALDQLRAQLR